MVTDDDAFDDVIEKLGRTLEDMNVNDCAEVCKDYGIKTREHLFWRAGCANYMQKSEDYNIEMQFDIKVFELTIICLEHGYKKTFNHQAGSPEYLKATFTRFQKQDSADKTYALHVPDKKIICFSGTVQWIPGEKVDGFSIQPVLVRGNLSPVSIALYWSKAESPALNSQLRLVHPTH